MENRPIPQDITGFQFKLIGPMTVRQFIYLGTGAVIAAVVFFILPISIIIRLPVALISLSVGLTFAFIPVGGRPMDVMVVNFFKALFAPTQYIYQKTGDTFPTSIQVANPPIVSQTTPTSPTPAITETRNLAETQSVASVIAGSPQPPPQVDWQKKLAEAEEQRISLQKELETLRLKVNQPPQPVAAPPVQTLPPQPQVPPEPTPPAPLQTPRVQFPQPEKPPYGAPPPKQAPLLAMPDSPNLIVGIISDPRGNPLQNILVEVKDEEGNPVRAFKTNGLGQFAGATPLANGKYILVFEDPKGVNKFDSIQIEAVGNPIPPVQITSIDAREELRRELFT